MIENISKIGGFFETLWKIISGIFNWLSYIIDFITSSVALPIALQPYMPQILGSMIMTVAGLAVVKTILGR